VKLPDEIQRYGDSRPQGDDRARNGMNGADGQAIQARRGNRQGKGKGHDVRPPMFAHLPGNVPKKKTRRRSGNELIQRHSVLSMAGQKCGARSVRIPPVSVPPQ